MKEILIFDLNLDTIRETDLAEIDHLKIRELIAVQSREKAGGMETVENINKKPEIL